MPFNFDADVLIHGQRVRTRPLPVLHPGKSLPRNVVLLLRSAGIMLQLSCTAKDDVTAVLFFLLYYRRLQNILFARFPAYVNSVIIGRELRRPYTLMRERYIAQPVQLKMLPKRAKSRR